uniref:Uncharacterized protein n=1 Tax=Percolomonas cosmopolitus TaxID=63605 RepID=A0A7S1KUB2_9EUKA|mmetsp:Transcript_9026/g.33285  ORF Transcript_9026/g.33285 Transcript_9026/m.33285 type:complete len:546 (+) Transcript_9026:551-2188(+)|eukprot:CAMPEP_0117445646 /NCGR_PEP_ID=MMETSP0759-20121206/5910_1 /TAXON_ID=63605 /ORGANISM="Percolomonas cosmopolitus, Strain WS" /LENGTH=545 /DNA_ID=CAMNT_0005237843 /DNA_START=451 /DNA_END=2088 /DNA_ORIENTATION=-
MTGKQHKPAGLSVNTARQNANAAMSPLDSILPMKKRSLRTNTLSATTPHDDSAAESKAAANGNLVNGRKVAGTAAVPVADGGHNSTSSSTTTQKKNAKRAPPAKRAPQKKKAARKPKKKVDLDNSSEMDSDNELPTVPANVNLKKKSGDVFQQYYRNTETWKIVQEKKNVFAHRKGTPSQHIHTMVKNSKQDPSEKIDEKLYSSLKYVLLHKVNPSYFVDENGDMGFILCRVQVVCPETGEEIKRNGEGILGGSIESSLRMDAVTSMKIQFTSCSSHHDKKQFAFRLQYFLNSNLKEPILVKQSTPFLVYARKKTGTKRKKRSKTAKDTTSPVELEEPKAKRVRKNPKKEVLEEEEDEDEDVAPDFPDQSATFNALAREMDRIKSSLFDHLPASEKSQAKALVAEKYSISLERFPSNHLSSALSAHAHFTSSSGIPQTIGTINTPATPSGLFSSNTGTLLTPLQTPNPDATNGSGVPQPILMHGHEDHHFKHHETMEDHEQITAHHHHAHHHHAHIQHGTDATADLYAQTPHEHSTEHDMPGFLM